MDEDKYIFPPRLNRKHIVFGFTVWELFSLLFLIVLAFVTRKAFFIPAAAILAAVSFRPPEKDVNALLYLRILFRYFRISPIYSLRECDSQ